MLSLESSVHPGTRLPMVPVAILWYAYCVAPRFCTELFQTSMFVPEPVISLAIKAKGIETPNFSRALNRFQKAVLVLTAAMMLLFTAIYLMAASRKGFLYQNALLNISADHASGLSREVCVRDGTSVRFKAGTNVEKHTFHPGCISANYK